jgi:hypothetical protein
MGPLNSRRRLKRVLSGVVILSSMLLFRHEGLAQVPVATPALQPITVMAPLGLLSITPIKVFEQSVKQRVRVDWVTSHVEMEAKLRASPFSYDVVVGEESKLMGMADLRLFLPLDKSQVASSSDSANYSTNYSTNGSSSDAERESSQQYFVPFLRDIFGVAWRSGLDFLPEVFNAYADIFQPKILKFVRGRVAMDNLAARALLLGYLEQGGAEVQARGPEHTLPAAKWAQKFITTLMPPPNGVEKSLVSGEAQFAFLWRSDFVRISGLVPNLNWAAPSKKRLETRMGAIVMQDSRYRDQAKQLVETFVLHRDQMSQSNGLEAWEKNVSPNSTLLARCVPLPKETLSKLREDNGWAQVVPSPKPK